MKLSLMAQENSSYQIACTGPLSVPDFGTRPDPVEELIGENCFSQRLLLNLEQAVSIDSSGVSWLIRCHKRCREKGGIVVLHSIPPTIQNVLDLLRMDKVLRMADNLPAAKAIAEERQ